MKVSLILLCFAILNGCSSTKDIVNTKNMQVVNATFKQWSEPPRSGSDIPERGTNLTVMIQNWPEAYSPQFIVRNKWKSFPTTITDSTGNRVVITGRIIRTSGMMKEKSGKVNLSDRLVFINAEGKSGYIEINDWQRAESSN
ncbi:MAG TPA: hypothetical protein VF181_10125 [Balneolaceae bacterium]